VEHYARSRSRESQLSALASPQSEPLEGRGWLEERVAELQKAHPAGAVPVGERWGGFSLAPERYEFWQSGVHRLHDRFEYVAEPDGGWTVRRLAP
jgi:pyridoxamine 5'-phosphate oxidase